MDLSEKMKAWPMLAAHRFGEIEAVLLSLEARLTALEPKQEEKKPEPVAEVKPLVPTPVAPAPIVPDPVLANPFVTPAVTAAEPNPLEGVKIDS